MRGMKIKIQTKQCVWTAREDATNSEISSEEGAGVEREGSLHNSDHSMHESLSIRRRRISGFPDSGGKHT